MVTVIPPQLRDLLLVLGSDGAQLHKLHHQPRELQHVLGVGDWRDSDDGLGQISADLVVDDVLDDLGRLEVGEEDQVEGDTSGGQEDGAQHPLELDPQLGLGLAPHLEVHGDVLAVALCPDM